MGIQYILFCMTFFFLNKWESNLSQSIITENPDLRQVHTDSLHSVHSNVWSPPKVST